MSSYKYDLYQLKMIAEKLAKDASSPFLILLNGEVGSGKTTFSQFFIDSLLINKQPISSPTFNIIQVYESIKGPIWHVDLYRIKHQNEIFQLGLLEAIHDYICLIEWPDLLLKYIQDCKYQEIFL